MQVDDDEVELRATRVFAGTRSWGMPRLHYRGSFDRSRSPKLLQVWSFSSTILTTSQDPTWPSICALTCFSRFAMNSAGVQDALKHLSGHLSDLDQNLAPLLTTALSETTKKLPLLERAKLYSTIVYAIESLIFCRIHPAEIPMPTDTPHHSIPKTPKPRRKITPGLQRATASSPVLRQDQRCGGRNVDSQAREPES